MAPTRNAHPEFRSPIPLSTLPREIRDAFSKDFKMVRPGAFLDGTTTNDVNQVPDVCKPFMERRGEKWIAVWSSALIDALMKCPIGALSPGVYPGASLQIQEALRKFCSVQSKQHVAVLGSISPWVECLVLREAPQLRIDTVDYDPITIDARIPFQMSFVPVSSAPKEAYDVVVSFSSIEHDGLGRYGDPIDVDGDVCAVQEACAMLKPGGFFVCGVPIGEMSVVEGNYHRIYSAEGLDRLFEGLVRVGEVPYPFGAEACSFLGTEWMNQPVFVLRKPLSASCTFFSETTHA